MSWVLKFLYDFVCNYRLQTLHTYKSSEIRVLGTFSSVVEKCRKIPIAEDSLIWASLNQAAPVLLVFDSESGLK